jgi:ribonucleoside-triphosphate reductase
MITVMKRGESEGFNSNRIRNAIIQAANQISYPNFDLIDSLTNKICRLIMDKSRDNRIEVKEIENIVMSVLYSDAPDIAREYSSYKMDKERAKENPTEIEKVLYVNDDIKYENGNKNPNLVHIKNAYLAEIPSKEMMKKLLPKDCWEAHERSVVYFHDSAYSARSLLNCTKGDVWIDVRKTDKKDYCQKTTIEDFFKLFENSDKDCLVNIEDGGYQILARDGWTKIKRINRRKLEPDEVLYQINVRNGLPLNLTGGHRLPILRNGKELLLNASEIKKGDSLLSFDDNKLLTYEEVKESFIDWNQINDEDIDIRVSNISILSNYLKYKYNFTLNYYIKKIKKIPIKGTITSIKLEFLIEIINKFPVPHEVLNKLLINSCGSKHKYPFLIPYSPQLAKLYGYIYSDGSVYRNNERGIYHVTFTNTNEEMLNDYLECFEEVFGRKLNKNYPSVGSTSPCVRIQCGDKITSKIFKDYAGGKMLGSGNLKIPNFIMYGNSSIKYSYLSASIDSDGSITPQNISLTSACRAYCEQIVLMLQSLGYTPTLCLKDKAGSKYHFGNSNRTGTRNFDSYIVKISKNTEKMKLYKNLSTIKSIDAECYNTISRYNNPCEIISINTYYEDCFVYDIETETHWYNINNYFSHNCCLWNLESMFKGCSINSTYIETPKSFRTACTVASQALTMATSSQYGGITINLLHLAKFVDISRQKIRKEVDDELSLVLDNISDSSDFNYEVVREKIVEERLQKEIRDGMQTFLYQTNTLCSGTGQAAFLSVGCWLSEDPRYSDDLIMVYKELIRQRLEGMRQEDGTYSNPNFPKILYVLDEDTMKGGKYYDITKLSAKCSASRLVPDYLGMKKHKELKGVLTFPMGCRSLLNPYQDENGNYITFGRANLGVQTLNLPYIAMENNKEHSEEILFKNLDHYMKIAQRDMLWRANHIAKIKAKENPLALMYGGYLRLQPEETLEKYVYSGYFSISLGYAGLREAVYYITGEDQFHDKGNKLAHKILDYLNNKNDELREKTGLAAGLYGTPMETGVEKFANACIRDFGQIGDGTQHNYITNSYHHHVSDKVDAFTKLIDEAQFSDKTTSGSISYVEIPNLFNNIGAMLEIIECIGENCLYGETNSEISQCKTCGFKGYDFKKKLDEKGLVRWECPKCGEDNPEKLLVSYRICGYISNYTPNAGRSSDIYNRVKHLN